MIIIWGKNQTFIGLGPEYNKTEVSDKVSVVYYALLTAQFLLISTNWVTGIRLLFKAGLKAWLFWGYHAPLRTLLKRCYIWIDILIDWFDWLTVRDLVWISADRFHRCDHAEIFIAVGIIASDVNSLLEKFEGKFDIFELEHALHLVNYTVLQSTTGTLLFSCK